MMTVDFTKPVLFDATNNGYMVTLDNGWPYEVVENDPGALWADIQAWLSAGNVAQPYVPPEPIPPTIKQQLAALDSIISRDIEDMYAELGKTPAFPARADAIKQKQALRAQLKNGRCIDEKSRSF
jgi:hypothetical protein